MSNFPILYHFQKIPRTFTTPKLQIRPRFFISDYPTPGINPTVSIIIISQHKLP